MEMGMVGLGRMGGNMARRLLAGGHRLVVYDPVKQARDAIVQAGAVAADSLSRLARKLAPPRSVWLMVPSGAPTENTIAGLAAVLGPGDTIIDGGNSYYRDSMRRGASLAQKSISFLDVGTSGGIWGLKEGYCMMVGGDIAVFDRHEPVFKTLAPSPSSGYGYVGPGGAGHFVKMVHNAIEYGMMEAYAEGFELMQAKKEFCLDLQHVADIWRDASVIRSWLLDLTAAALKADPSLDRVQSYVDDSGEGRWTVAESIDLAVPLPSIALALQMRFRSRQSQPFAGRLLAVMRRQFGGHAVKKEGGF